jgi:hypothetical protein
MRWRKRRDPVSVKRAVAERLERLPVVAEPPAVVAAGVLTQTVRRRPRWTRMSWRCRRLFGPGWRWAWRFTASTSRMATPRRSLRRSDSRVRRMTTCDAGSAAGPT